MRLASPAFASTGALLLLVLTAAPAAQAITVAAKPGLWERTVTTRLFETRTVVPEVASKPAEERQKFEAEMRKPVYAPDVVNTSRECLSQGASASWEALTKVDADYGACTRKTLAQNARSFKASLSCNSGKSTGKVEFKATVDQVQGDITLVTHEPSYDRTQTKRITLKRVSPACEKVSQQ